MKIASYIQNGNEAYGVIIEDSIITASDDFKRRFPTLRDVLNGNAIDQFTEDTQTRKIDHKLDEVQLLPPITNPERIFCVDINYPKALSTR